MALDVGKREEIKFEDEQDWLDARTHDLTSSDISALFGCNKWVTEFDLWHRKASGDVPAFEATERMILGNVLESGIAEHAANVHNWKIQKFKTYIRRPDLRIGSSFDYKRLAVNDFTTAVIEIKKIDYLIFRDQFIDEDDYNEAPPYIEFQVQHEMLVSGLDHAVICILVGGNEMKYFEREADEGVQQAILEKAAEFWESVDTGIPPKADFERDADNIAAMYVFAEAGKIMDATGDEHIRSLCEQITQLGKDVRTLDETRKAFRAELLTLIDDAERVLVDGFTISAKMIGEKEISFIRKPSRSLRVTAKKVKV